MHPQKDAIFKNAFNDLVYFMTVDIHKIVKGALQYINTRDWKMVQKKQLNSCNMCVYEFIEL